MIKFIHCADMHLGSAFTSHLPSQKREERRRELRAAFGAVASAASAGGCAAVLVCGDAFDTSRPLKKDKEYFYGVVKAHPGVQFLYLRGNHDTEESYTEELENLKTFSREWTYYSFGNVVVAGIELCEENCRSLYSTLSLDSSKFNIVMLHGQTAESEGAGNIVLSRLRGKNIDYLALGHVHSFASGRLDGRGVYAYCGCLEPRGFDEPGQKGYISLACAPGGAEYTFVPSAARTVLDFSCDLSGCPDWASAVRFASSACPRSPKDMLRLTLTGEVTFDSSELACDVQKELEAGYYLVSVRDNTCAAEDISSIGSENSLRGAFVRAVTAAGEYSAEEKSRIISAGLKALAGRGNQL